MENLNEILTSIKKQLAELENNCIKRNEAPQLVEKRKTLLIIEELRKKLYFCDFIETKDLIFLLLQCLCCLESNNSVTNWFKSICEDMEI